MPDAVLAAIHGRRSARRVSEEPIAREIVRELLDAAVAAPNHHLTGPWRFIVLAGDARRALGQTHARAVARARSDLTPEGLRKEAARLARAPVVIVCCVVPGPDPVEAREDRDAVAAGVQNLLLAAHARGLGAMWRTGAMADEPEVRSDLGLGERDAIVGFVYLGRPLGDSEAAARAPRPGAEAFTDWRGW
jgi:nitroreductase